MKLDQKSKVKRGKRLKTIFLERKRSGAVRGAGSGASSGARTGASRGVSSGAGGRADGGVDKDKDNGGNNDSGDVGEMSGSTVLSF